MDDLMSWVVVKSVGREDFLNGLHTDDKRGP